MRPDSTVVFSFPKKAPDGVFTRKDAKAIEHLELWLTYQRHWCEHKPSITISVLEKEWPEVGAWVWKHFDEISGVSFLPMDGGTYRQAPYEEISKEEYDKLHAESVKTINWNLMKEEEDNVEGVQTLACTGGVCEI
jgi:ribonucleoside-diphosphate reductase alpha chain